MVFDAYKAECMLLGTRQKLRCANANFCVRDNNYVVTPVTTHMLLRLHVDSYLSWNVHVTKLCCKLRSRLYLFNQVEQTVIDYGCVIWDSCGKALFMNVLKMMMQYARIILNVKDRRQVSTGTLFCTLGWLSIDARIRYFIAILMYDIIHGLAPAYLTYIFILNNSVHDHHTRECTNTHVRKYKLPVGQRTFAYGETLFLIFFIHFV